MPSQKEILGATLFVLGETVTINDICHYTGIDKTVINDLLSELNSDYNKVGIKIINTDEGVRLVTISGVEPILEKIKEKELDGDLTPAQLQVMTIIAYMPGCTRSDISYVRGAQSAASIRNLIMRGLIYRKDEQCYITNEALSHLGVDRSEDLPEYNKLNSEFKTKLQESLAMES